MAEQGIKGLYKGWGPTVVGYSLQGACKFGLYEFFKHTYAEMVGEPFATDHKSLVFLAGSASAEFVADIGLCPFEAIKVRVQTMPGYAKGLTDGMSKFIATEGIGGYKIFLFCNCCSHLNIFEYTKHLVYINFILQPQSIWFI